MDLKYLLQGMQLIKMKAFAVITLSKSVKTVQTSARKSSVAQTSANSSIKSYPKNKRKKNGYYSEQADEKKETSCRRPLTRTGNAMTESEQNMEFLFPRNTHWFVFLFTMVFRVWYVSRMKNWWILHPDEIYQTLEVAHSEVYGYGFRTYEYLQEKQTGYHVSAARAQEVELGMFSLRSFMLPHLISVFIFLADKTGLSVTPYLTGRVVLAITTSFLPVSVYYFTRSALRSHNTASLAAILVATSETLNVFGTHSLVNSFLSPFVFLGLTPLVESLSRCDGQQESSKTVHRNQIPTRDHNSNLSVINRNQCSKVMGVDLQTIKHSVLGNYKMDIKRDASIKYLSGVLLSFCVYTRCDLILLPIFILVVCTKISFSKISKLLLDLIVFLGGFITGVFIGGFYDRMCYGVWFISPYQWIKFNIFRETSSLLFGKESVIYYVEKLLCSETFNVLLLVILFVDLFASCLLQRNFPNENLKSPLKQMDFMSTCVFMFLLLTYSFASHKELRFFQNGFVFLYIHASNAVLRLFKTIVNFANQKYSQYYCWIYLFIGILASSQLLSFLNIQGKAISNWTYMGNNVSHEVNGCLHYISQQDDVTGVFLYQPIYMTGGYSILHKDVPIFTLNMHEFFEFSRGSRLKTSNYFNQNIPISSFSYISDFVSVYNTPYLLKQLISKPEYNYLVLDIDQSFVETGYSEVLRIGSSKVIKRQMTNESEASLFKMASDIPLGENSTILEYEGYWLLRYGLYEIAEEKLLLANRLDSSKLGPYQLLIRLFHYFKQDALVRNVLDACLELHELSECKSEYNIIKLHDAYFKGT